MDNLTDGVRHTGHGGAVSRHDREKTDYDWVYIASGVLFGGFTATVWYPVGPVVAGLYLLPILAGAVVLGAVVELIYRAFIRPRQAV